MKVQMRDLIVINFLFRHWSSSYTFILTLGIHYGCLHFISKSDWLTFSTAGLMFVAFIYNTYDMCWGFRDSRREINRIKVEIARLQEKVPVHIPDKQVLKYLKKKKRKEKYEVSMLQK